MPVLLDEITDALSAQPISVLMIIFTALFATISPDSVLIALPMFFILNEVKYVLIVLCCISVVSLVLLLIFTPMTLSVFPTIGLTVWSEMFKGHWFVLLNPWVISEAIPMACALCFLLIILNKAKPRLATEVKRLSNGKTKRKAKILSLRKRQKKLQAIQSVATHDGSILGISIETGKPVCLTDKQANLHTLAIGTTGSGKTTAIANVIESIILRGLPAIIVDGKGDLTLMQQVKQFAKSHHRKFYGFSMLGDSVKYNPLASGGITSKKDRIIELREWTEDHYRKIAEGYLQTVFEILNGSQVQIDLYQLAHYLELPALRSLLQQQKAPNKVLLRRLEDKQKDIASLKAEIENLVHSEIGHLFNCNGSEALRLAQALEENAIVYFCLQPLAFPAYANCLGKLIINDIKSLAAEQLKEHHKKTLYTIFDEFSVFAGDQIINLINQGRSAGIHAILSTQSLSDLSRAGGDAFVGQVLNNCNNYLIQRQNNPDDAETLAKVVGTNDHFEFTSQVSSAMGGTNVGTVKSVKEYLIHPDEIKRLGLGEGFYVNKQEFEVVKVVFRRTTVMAT